MRRPRRLQVKGGLAITRNEGVEVNEVFETRDVLLGDSGYDHAGIAMPDQDYLGQVFIAQHTPYVTNMSDDAYLACQKVGAFAHTGKRRRVNYMAGTAQIWHDALPAPATVHRAVNQDKGSQGRLTTPKRFAE